MKALASLRQPGTIFFLISLVLLTVGSFSHEFWSDEARPWLIAEAYDFSGLPELLRYESHPIGWYALLKLLFLAGLPPESMKILSLTFSLTAFWFLMFRSPFTSLQKFLLTINIYLVFQYGFHARSYSMELAALFGLCALYHVRSTYRIAWSGLTVLLAFSHPYGFMLSTLFVLRSGMDFIQSKDRKDLLVFIGVLSLTLLSGVMLMRPSDSLNVIYGLKDLNLQRILIGLSFSIQSVFLLVRPGPAGWDRSLISHNEVFNYLALIGLIPAALFVYRSWKLSRFSAVFFLLGSFSVYGLMVMNRFADFSIKHLGQITVILLCTLWIRKDTGGWRLFFPLFLQAVSGIIVISDDLRFPYSMGPEVARELGLRKESIIVADPPYFSSSWIIHTDGKIFTSDQRESRVIPANGLLMTTFRNDIVTPLAQFTGALPRSTPEFVKTQLESACLKGKKVSLVTIYEIDDRTLQALNLTRGPAFTGALVPVENYMIYDYNEPCDITER